MNKKLKIIMPIVFISFILTTLVLVFSSWIITTSTNISSEEITTIYDPSLEKYSLKNEFDYDKQNKFPHIDLGTDPETGVDLYKEFTEKYDVTYFTKNVSGELSPAKNIMNAGTYVARYFNKEERIYSDYTYKINPIAPSLTVDYDNSTKQYYKPTLGPTESNVNCQGDYGDGELKGTLTLTKSLPLEGSTDINALKLSVVCLFTPTNKNYTSAKVTIDIPLYAVARIKQSYYSRVETALENAISGDEIRIMIGTNPTIYEDCTIKDGVTLHINFAEESKNSSTGTHEGSSTAYTVKNKVTLNSNVIMTIENGGKLEVGGELTGGGANAKCGATVGSTSELIMNSKSGIICDGVIDCYGFIRESSKNNESYITVNTGSVYLPFIIRDFRGGSITYGIYNKFDSVNCPPFNQMQFENIEPLLTLKYNSKLYGYANLYAGSQQNPTTIGFVSNTNQTLIQFTDARYSYLTAKYDNSPESECLSIDIYGGASTNAMAMSLKVLGTINVSTEKVYFALTFRQKVSLNVNKESGQNIANYSINQRYKLMPGASLTVNEGAILEATNMTVYKESDYIVTAAVGSSPYPSGKGDAKLIINGELHIGTIGGLIISNRQGSFLFTKGAVRAKIREPLSSSGSSLLTTVEFTNQDKDSTVYSYQENNPPTEVLAESGIYESKSYIVNGQQYYYWEKYADEDVNEFVIKYVTNSDETTLSNRTIYSLETSVILDSLVLPDAMSLSKKGYEFKGWYIDSSFNTSANNYQLSLSNPEITVYAKWEIENYSINYLSIIDNAEEDEKIDISSQIINLPISYNISSSKPSLPDLTYDGYDFLDWYYYENETLVLYDNFDVNIARDIILVARFKKAEKPYQINYELINNETGAIIQSGTFISGLKDLSSFNVNNYAADIKTNFGNSQTDSSLYFEGYNKADTTGWYTDKTFVSSLSSLSSEHVTDASGEYQVITIYGKLLNKITVTYEGSSSLYYIPLSTISALDAKDNTDANIHMWENTNFNILCQYGGNFTLPSENVTLTKVTFVKTTLSNDGHSTITITSAGNIINASYEKMGSVTSGTCYVRSLSNVSVTTTHTGNQNNHSTKITTGTNTIFTSTTAGAETSYTVDALTAYTITTTSENQCVTYDTLITLADGTKKMVKDLLPTDLLLVFNHETGKYEFAPMIFNDFEPEGIYRIVNLKFSDGTVVKVVYEHGFFDTTLNKYVYIREDNMNEFIGHKFYQGNYDGTTYTSNEVTLVDAYVTEELTTVYSPVTVYHLNYFTEDMLSMPAGIPGLFNIFEYGDNLTFDKEQMEADIEKYGLYTYDDFKDYISYEVYSMFPAPYLKVAVGKGLTTYEEIIEMIYLYLEKHDLMK